MTTGLTNIADQVSILADTYSQNPAALQKRARLPHGLIELLALQQIKQEQAAKKRQIQMQMQTNPDTVANQIQNQVLNNATQDVARQVGGIAQRPPTGGPMGGQPPMRPQGQPMPAQGGAPVGRPQMPMAAPPAAPGRGPGIAQMAGPAVRPMGRFQQGGIVQGGKGREIEPSFRSASPDYTWDPFAKNRLDYNPQSIYRPFRNFSNEEIIHIYHNLEGKGRSEERIRASAKKELEYRYNKPSESKERSPDQGIKQYAVGGAVPSAGLRMAPNVPNNSRHRHPLVAAADMAIERIGMAEAPPVTEEPNEYGMEIFDQIKRAEEAAAAETQAVHDKYDNPMSNILKALQGFSGHATFGGGLRGAGEAVRRLREGKKQRELDAITKGLGAKKEDFERRLGLSRANRDYKKDVYPRLAEQAVSLAAVIQQDSASRRSNQGSWDAAQLRSETELALARFRQELKDAISEPGFDPVKFRAEMFEKIGEQMFTSQKADPSSTEPIPYTHIMVVTNAVMKYLLNGDDPGWTEEERKMVEKYGIFGRPVDQ